MNVRCLKNLLRYHSFRQIPCRYIGTEPIITKKASSQIQSTVVNGLSIPKDKNDLIKLVYEMAQKHIAALDADFDSGAWIDYQLTDANTKFRLTKDCSSTFLGFPISAADLTNITTLGDLVNYVDLYTLEPLSKRWFVMNNPFQPIDKIELFFKENQKRLPDNLYHVTSDDTAETFAQQEHLNSLKYWKYYGRWRLDAIKSLKIRFKKARGKQMQRVYLSDPLWKRAGEP